MKTSIDLYNHYLSPISFQHQALHAGLQKVLKYIHAAGKAFPKAPLLTLKVIEFNLVDDVTIAEVHQEFMDDPTTTDVITFHHGEIFVSYDTALREATARGIKLEEELFRYHVHGLLHLAGYDDLTEKEYNEMHTLQEEIIKQYF